MKLNIFHILVVVSISGVISDDPGIIVNGNNKTDVPTASTIIQNVTTPIPTTTTTNSSTNTTVAPTTPTTPTTTTILPPTTQSTPKTTVVPSTATTPTSNGTTSAAPPSSTTVGPAPVPPSHRGRKFDGPSFIGGIILASGLMAICFVSWKFYKARTERNYHTL